MSAILVLAGCAGPRGSGMPTPRPLGRDIQSFHVSSDDVEESVPAAVVQGQDTITFRHALAFALMKNPGLAAFSWEVRASEARALQQGLLPNPELEVEVEGYDEESTGFDTAESAIVLSQLIELGGKRRKRTNVATLERNMAGWDYEAKRLDVFVETAQAFVDVLAAQRSVTLAGEAVALAEKVQTAVGERVKAGKVSPLEESRAGVELSMSKLGFRRAQKEFDASRLLLGSMWGDPEPSFTSVTGAFETILGSLPPLDSLKGHLAQNPDIARWEMEIEMREAAVDLERSAAMPDLAASAGVQTFEATGEDALIFGVAFALPLFDRNQGSIQAARHQLSKAKEEERAAETVVQRGLADAYTELTVSHAEAVTLKRDILPAAQRAFEAVRDGYQQGKFGYLDVLDAQRTMFEVMAKHVESLAAYHKAVVALERLIGRSIDVQDAELRD